MTEMRLQQQCMSAIFHLDLQVIQPIACVLYSNLQPGKNIFLGGSEFNRQIKVNRINSINYGLRNRRERENETLIRRIKLVINVLKPELIGRDSLELQSHTCLFSIVVLKVVRFPTFFPDLQS